jgi:hypothetical protein
MHVEDMPARQMLQEPKQPLVSKAAAFMDRLLLCSHFFFFFALKLFIIYLFPLDYG